ncbi:hypothetical protein VTN31DRAFT_159 [Thermomyces dupontii]|uniref:uncharacterized protein n=1 Tax=Talaromyces thermophilus TaxID=28565 RepID=UPI003743B7F8
MSSNRSDLQPGYSVLRLRGIERLSSTQKTKLIDSIAWDLKSVFIALNRYTQAGTLRSIHTASIDNMLRTVFDVEVRCRRRFEAKLRAQKRIVGKLRRERRRLRKRILSSGKGTKKLLRAAAGTIRQLACDLTEARRLLASLGEVGWSAWKEAPGGRREMVDTGTQCFDLDGGDDSSMNEGVCGPAGGGLFSVFSVSTEDVESEGK